jgi:hypothetical protein
LTIKQHVVMLAAIQTTGTAAEELP